MKIGIYWFRKALRLHDNLPLLRATNECDIVYPIFFLDPAFTTKPSNIRNHPHGTGVALPSKNVFRFFFETLADLDRSLSSKKYGSKLFVIRGDPTKIFPKLLEMLKITDLYFETDTEPYAKKRDHEVIGLCQKSKVSVHCDYGHTLYPPEYVQSIVDRLNKPIPGTYRGFTALLPKLKNPQPPQPAPQRIPGAQTVRKLYGDQRFGEEMARISGWPQLGFKPPQVSELPFDDSEPIKVNEYEIEEQDVRKYMNFVGGESNGLKVMKKYLANKRRVCEFEKPKTSPNSLMASTTTCSMYLTNGSLSVRLFWHEINKVYRESNFGHTQPPMSLHGQLYFREWFYLLSNITPNFHQMKGNPICKQIKWGPFDEEKLRRSGWMHHLGRHAVACFLTRGDLWQHWEVGRKVFSEYLLDGDYALNSANWMWLSASAFFTAYFRVYSPIGFGQKTDKNGDFIRHWIPKLKNYPKKYIYAPWTAPKELQEHYGCVIGKDYPKPIVDHLEAKNENMGRMKSAYEAHKRNKNKRTKTGNGSGRRGNGNGDHVMSQHVHDYVQANGVWIAKDSRNHNMNGPGKKRKRNWE